MILIVFRLWWLRTALFSFIKSATNTHKRTHSEAHRSDVINRAIQSLPGFVTKESSNEWEQDNPPQSSSPSFFVQEAVGTAANQHFNLASWHYQFTDRLDSFCALSGIQFYLNVSRPSLGVFSAFSSPMNETPSAYSTVYQFISSTYFLWHCRTTAVALQAISRVKGTWRHW